MQTIIGTLHVSPIRVPHTSSVKKFTGVMRHWVPGVFYTYYLQEQIKNSTPYFTTVLPPPNPLLDDDACCVVSLFWEFGT